MAIRYTNKDIENIENVVKQFNKKIERIVNQEPRLQPFLPSRISKNFIKNISVNRNDLNRNLNSYRRFLKSGSESPITLPGGVQTTKWQLQEINLANRIINKRRGQERRALQQAGTATQSIIENNSLNPRRFNPENFSARQFEAYISSTRKQVSSNYQSSVEEQYKANYLSAIDNNLANSIYSSDLRDYVSKIPAGIIYRAARINDKLVIDFIYDPSTVEERVTTLLQLWKQYYNIDE